MLVITGTGRCGTSMLAKFCERVGYDPGGGWDNTIDGGKEDSRLVAMNTNIEGGLTPDLSKVQQPVIKDPRFVIYKKVFNYWVARLDDIKFLVLHRNLINVVRSVQRHPNWFEEDDVRGDISKLRKRVVAFYDELIDSGVEYHRLRFPQFLKNYDMVYHTLTDFGELDFDYQEGKQIWNELVDLDKVHV